MWFILLVANCTLYYAAFKVFPEQKLEFFALSVVLILVNNIYTWLKSYFDVT